MTHAETHDIATTHPRFMAAETLTTVQQRRTAGTHVVRELGRDCRDVLDALGICWENTR